MDIFILLLAFVKEDKIRAGVIAFIVAVVLLYICTKFKKINLPWIRENKQKIEDKKKIDKAIARIMRKVG